MDQEIHIAVEGEQRVFGQWMKRSEKNARPQKSLGHGIALSRRFVGVAQEANRLKAARAIILGFWALALKSGYCLPTGHWRTALRQPRHRIPNSTTRAHEHMLQEFGITSVEARTPPSRFRIGLPYLQPFRNSSWKTASPMRMPA
jgi:hypothetical protein